ncbi:MAG: lactate utilization protein [Oscillospiraceae bacterium]|nr:lactate utilization protein [Oscillospiraceae bacterium]
MNEHLAYVRRQQAERVMQALRKNRMQPYYAATAAEVAPLVKSLVPQGACVAMGGSMTLAECGVESLLRGGDYRLLDRYAPGLSREEGERIMREAFFCDWYFSSTNAVTEAGELYNVDGNANRVAALAYGPANVCIVAGINKIVPDLAAAQRRVKETAAPANTHRLGCATPCAKTGKCENCTGPGRICCTTLVLQQQRAENRIKVILVGEELGY